MNVLSLFDGISCGRVALERAGIPVGKYYAYEIEPNAIKVSKKNYPDIIHCGDVMEADFTQYEGIDLLIGGSPCTNWSCSKNHKAKEKKEQFINEGMGWELFKQYKRAVDEAKPRYFLYENNFKISKNIIEAITDELGVEPIMIDSQLVSAQRRKRLYWTNIPNVTQPLDKGLLLKDVFIYDEALIRVDHRIPPSAVKTKNYIQYDLTGRGDKSEPYRLHYLNGKAPTLPKSRTESKCNILVDEDDWSKYKIISPVEAERLQTLPDNYTDCVPKTRRFEAIGNGWTVDVIAHILSFIPTVVTDEEIIKAYFYDCESMPCSMCPLLNYKGKCCNQYVLDLIIRLKDEIERLKANDDFEKVTTLMHHISILNGIIVKEKAEKARLERKYNRYYHLVEDFYRFLFHIGKMKEFTLFHEEKEIEREAD